MTRDRSFWRNVAIIGLVHVAVLSAVVRSSSAPQKAPASNIVWIDGGAGLPEGNVAAATQPVLVSPPEPEPIDTPEPVVSEQKDEPSEITENDLKSPTAIRRAKPVTTPRATPRPTTKPSPKPTPKKIVVAKASATPRPAKPSPSAAPTKAPEQQVEKESAAPTPTTDVPSAIAAAAKTGTAPTVGISGTGAGGPGGHGAGLGGASQFGWYAHMLHDRFFSQWSQPTSVVRSGAKMSTLVKLRIEKDGTVSRFTILKPSGNVVVDESVSEVAKRVTRVDPLPSGLGGSYYEVNINFELNSDQ